VAGGRSSRTSDGVAAGGSLNGSGSVCCDGHITAIGGGVETAARGSAAPAHVSASAAAKQPAPKRFRILLAIIWFLLLDSGSMVREDVRRRDGVLTAATDG